MLRQQFDGHSPFQLAVEGLENSPHGALAQLFHEPVLANLKGECCFVDVIVRIAAGLRCDRPEAGENVLQQEVIGVGCISSGAEDR